MIHWGLSLWALRHDQQAHSDCHTGRLLPASLSYGDASPSVTQQSVTPQESNLRLGGQPDAHCSILSPLNPRDKLCIYLSLCDDDAAECDE